MKLCENTVDELKVDLMNERTIKFTKLLFADYAPDTMSDDLHPAFRENRMFFSQHYAMMNLCGCTFVAFPKVADAENAEVVSSELASYSYEDLRTVVYQGSKEAFGLKGARDEEKHRNARSYFQ